MSNHDSYELKPSIQDDPPATLWLNAPYRHAHREHTKAWFHTLDCHDVAKARQNPGFGDGEWTLTPAVLALEHFELLIETDAYAPTAPNGGRPKIGFCGHCLVRKTRPDTTAAGSAA